jgi:signal peptidase
MENLEEMEDVRQTPLQRLISTLVTVLLVLSVLFCLYVAIQVLSDGYVNIGGFMMFRVVTGSMEPTIPTGALLISREVDIASVQVGDIVCFRTQEAEIWGNVITHRVVEVLNGANGILLRTQGDANLVADGYFVDCGNLIGKVIWHTGDESMLAFIFSVFTSKVGFLGCVVFPCLLLAGLILKECVGNIHRELNSAMNELETDQEDWQNDPLCGMTQQEYDQMYERIRAELIEELKNGAEESKTE